MEKKYKVLKKFDGYKKGDILDITSYTEEDLVEMVEKSLIEEVIEDTPDLDGEVIEDTPDLDGEVIKNGLVPGQDEKKSDVKEAVVVNARGIVMRTYTAEEHGKNFKELAKEFATKKGLLVK